MNNSKLICGELTPDTITMDASPSKHELFLLNAFKLKKKQASMKSIKTKYCSRGVHLGRSIAIHT